jgi:hypothetical protein
MESAIGQAQCGGLPGTCDYCLDPRGCLVHC